MLEFRFSADGFRRKMRRLIQNAPPKGKAMKVVAGMMHDVVEENFRVEGRPRWERRSPATTRAKAKRGKLGRLLEESGQLKSSITPSHTATEAIVGTNLKYAKYHHYGATQRVTKKQRMFLGMNLGLWKKEGSKLILPARPFLTIPKAELEKIKKRIGIELVMGVK